MLFMKAGKVTKRTPLRPFPVALMFPYAVLFSPTAFKKMLLSYLFTDWVIIHMINYQDDMKAIY